MEHYIWCILGILCVLHIPCFSEEFFNTTPPPIYTNFSCVGKAMGFYADIEANCRIYHTCDDQNNKFTYHCPENTAFRQEVMICDYAHLVDCRKGRRITDIAESHDDRTTAKSLVDRSKSNRNSQFPFFKEYTTQAPLRSFRITQKPFNPITTPTLRNNKNSEYFLGSRSINIGRHEDAQNLFNIPNNQVPSPITKPVTGFINCNEKTARCNSDTGSREFANKSPVTQGPNIKQGFSNSFPSLLNSFGRTDIIKTNIAGSSTTGTFTAPKTVSPYTQNNTNVRELNRTIQLTLNPKPLSFIPKSPFSFRNTNYPYSETLRSIQNHTQVFFSSSTTTPSLIIHNDPPVDSFTASLKPLKPNELEFDPYYPKIPVTTEAYYTPSDNNKRPKLFQFSTQSPLLGVQFDIPATLPDLNSLEDLIDRRKLLYIPRMKSR